MVVRVRTADRLARSLGWFSLGLGAAQIVAPGRVARLVGLQGDDGSRALMRAVGLREVATGIGIFARRRPAGWLWARAAGDAIDLALLGAALRAPSTEKRRTATAMAAVAGVTVPDVLTGARLSDDSRPTTEERGGNVNVKAAVTVVRPRDEVYGFWRQLGNLPRFMIHLESVEETAEGRSRWVAAAPAGRTVAWEAEITHERPGELLAWRSLPRSEIANAGVVRFVDAPGDRGTEVHVELTYDAPGGPLGDLLAKLAGEQPEQQVKDDLRRLKQELEVGEIVVSEGSPAGLSARQQLRQRPAQPFERERQPVAN